MQKILFVCLGNICRSPVAEGAALHLKHKHGIDVFIDSAGTAGYHIGEAPDRRTVANARRHGLDLSVLRARQFVVSDFEQFDHIFAMDVSNYNNMMRLASNNAQKEKVKLFLEFVYNEMGMEVPDPYYGTESDFEHVFSLVYKACEDMFRKLGYIGAE